MFKTIKLPLIRSTPQFWMARINIKHPSAINSIQLSAAIISPSVILLAVLHQKESKSPDTNRKVEKRAVTDSFFLPETTISVV